MKINIFETKRGDWDYFQSPILNSQIRIPIKLVIQKVLEKFKELAIIEIINNTPHIERETEKIKCVVTVHAIWDEHQKIL